MQELITKNELLVDDLRNHTWDYADKDVLGFFDGQIIHSYLFEASDINPLLVRRCNLAEGWIELFKVESEPKSVEDMKIVRDEEGEIVTERREYKGCLSILSPTGEIVVAI